MSQILRTNDWSVYQLTELSLFVCCLQVTSCKLSSCHLTRGELLNSFKTIDDNLEVSHSD